MRQSFTKQQRCPVHDRLFDSAGWRDTKRGFTKLFCGFNSTTTTTTLITILLAHTRLLCAPKYNKYVTASTETSTVTLKFILRNDSRQYIQKQI